MRSRLYRERRRFIFVAALTFLGGWLAFRTSTASLFGLPLELVAGLAFMVGLTAALMVVVLVFPQLRSYAEGVALGISVLSLMGSFDPDIGSTESSIVLVLGFLFMFLATVLYGNRWIDGLVPRRNAIYRSVAESRLPPEKLWPYVFVTPDSAPEFRSEITISLKWIDPGKSFCEVARAGNAVTVEELLTIVTVDPGSLFQFHFQAVHDPDNFGNRGMVTHRVTKTETGSRLDTIREFDRDSWRAALFFWIDDGWSRLDARRVCSYEEKETARAKGMSPLA